MWDRLEKLGGTISIRSDDGVTITAPTPIFPQGKNKAVSRFHRAAPVKYLLEGLGLPLLLLPSSLYRTGDWLAVRPTKSDLGHLHAGAES